ncbi:MAG TPA: chromate resistance protein ChrB domain-containing protein [Chloroflexia bacterium]|nr:chromate resistance protein ChrB domain-containing protein [Chloroflexia bacterium]
MKWVTRKGVKFDRTACAWLIKRFIDPDAEFGFLTGEEMPAALEAGARPFHNYAWTGNAEDLPQDRINFPKLISNYSLEEAHPGLPLMAETVRKAERVGWAKDGTEHYSLWAIANGIYMLVNGDDAGMVQGMMPVYDALYAYCRLRAEGKSGWTSDAS